MPITAAPINPEDSGVTVEAITTDVIKPKDMQPNTPKELPGISANMTPTAAAGVSLAKFVLWIVVGSIAVLMLYLLSMDITIGSNVAESYRKVYAVGALGSESTIVRQIDQFTKELTTARSKPEAQISADGLKAGEELAVEIAQLPGMSAGQSVRMASCLPPPNDASRSALIAECLSILDDLKTGIIQQASSVAHAQAASDAAKQINEQRQNFHTFWIQAAQLILLNLLLPLLTALLGYVFGTQQGSRATS